MPTDTYDIRKLAESVTNHPSLNYIIKLKIKEIEVPGISIVGITIREWIFDVLPRIELQISDNGRMLDQFPLEDNDIIEIELNHNVFQEPTIKTRFMLQDYEVVNSSPGKNQQALINITGLIETDQMLFPIRNRVFSRKNSLEVFQSVATEVGIEDFVSRVEPQDEMSWLQVNQNNYDFLYHVLKRSFIGTNDVPFLYTTRKKRMIYTSLETELRRAEKTNQRAVFNINATILNSKNNDPDDLVDKIEEELTEYGNNTIFFHNWKYKNMAGGANKRNSYGRQLNYYDLTNDKMQQIKTDDHKYSTHSLKEKDKVGLITKQDSYGFLDADNTHENYFLAQSQNKYLSYNFFSSYMLLYTRPKENLNLFDTVNVEIPSLLPIESQTDEVHGGQYLVGGIIHQASKDSIYNTILILYRNGLNVKGLLKDFESRHSSEKVAGADISNPVVPIRNSLK